MARIGLINSINAAAAAIDSGRKGFATKGKAEEGRIFYERGISLAMSAFQDAQSTADLETITLAEYTFLIYFLIPRTGILRKDRQRIFRQFNPSLTIFR